MSDSLWPHGKVHGILQARILEWVDIPFSRGSFNTGIKPRSPALQVESSPAGPLGKPKNTGVGGLSLLQGTFPTQESNWGLCNCRQILYQLRDQRSPGGRKRSKCLWRMDRKMESLEGNRSYIITYVTTKINISNNWSIFKICKKLVHFNSKISKQFSFLKQNEQRIWINIQLDKKYVKRCSISLIIRKM